MQKLVNLEVLNDSIPIETIGIDGANAMASATQFVTAKRPKKLEDVVQCFLQNECIHFITDGSFSNHDLILRLLPFYEPCNVWLTTYAITETPARILATMVAEKRITNLSVLGDKRIRDRYPAVEQLISSVSTIKTTQIHAKVLVVENEKGGFCLLGSANWTTNPRIEFGVLDKSKYAIDFHKDWIIKKMNDADLFN